MNYENKLGWLFWLLITLPIVIYFAVFQRFAINVPYFDDHAFKAFIINFEQSNSWLEKLKLMFAQHNEHRVGYTRLMVWLTYLLNSKMLDFVGMMWVGNLSLLGTLWVFWRVFKQQLHTSIWYFLPVPYLLFSFLSQENTFWGMASLQNFTIVMWAIMVCYALAKQNLGASIILTIVATYTSGNGFLLWIVGLIYFSLCRNWRFLGYWILALCLTVGLYFAGYERPPGNPAEASLKDITIVMKGLLSFIGSIADVQATMAVNTRLSLAMTMGIFLLIAAMVMAIKLLLELIKNTQGANTRNHFFFNIILFIAGTTLLTVVARVFFGLEILLTSRYKIYSIILTVTLYLYYIPLLPPKLKILKGIGATGFGIAIFILSLYFSYEEIDYHRKYMACSAFNATQSPSIIQVPYQAPNLFWAKLLNNQSLSVGNSSVNVKRENHSFIIKNDTSTKGNGLDDGMYLLFSQQDSLPFAHNSYLYPVRQNRNRSKKNYLTTFEYWTKGFEIQVPDFEFPTGKYHLLLVENSSNQLSIKNTGKTFNVENKQKALLKNW